MSPSAPHEVDRMRRALAHPAPAPSDDPVDPEVLWRAARGEAAPAEVAALAERMTHDPALAEDWRIAVAFVRAEGTDAADQPSDHDPTISPLAAVPANRGDYTRWGPVVALLAAVVLLVLAWPRGGPRLPEGDPGALRGARGGITALQGEGPVARDHAMLEWSAVPGAMRYELYVSTPALEPVLTERAREDTTAVVPAELLRSMPAGTELLWRVEAVLDDDRRNVSPTFSLTVVER